MNVSTVMGIAQLRSIAQLYAPKTFSLTFSSVPASGSSEQYFDFGYKYCIIHQVHVDDGSSDYKIEVFSDSSHTKKELELTGTSIPDSKTNIDAYINSDDGTLYVVITNNDSSAHDFTVRIMVGSGGEFVP